METEHRPPFSHAPTVIAVLTYQRPDGLAQVLGDLVEHIEGSAVDASILVVDNDREPSASGIVGGIAGVSYVHEPRPGIAAARNRAIAESGDRRLLIFIDDDERPEPGWLDALHSTWCRVGSAAVVGPVVSRFPEDLDPWIEAGGFFRRLRHATGARVPTAATNNLLLDLDVVRSLGLRFDERFGISGGSDTFFTRSLVRAGGEIVWCDEAVVIDSVPTQRMTRQWVTQRARRLGNSSSRCSVLLAEPGPERWIARAAAVGQGSVRIVVGGARALAGRILGHERHHARGVRTFERGRGLLTGALGRIVVEYGRSQAGTDDR